MNYFLQFAILVFFLFLGELTNKLLNIPVPGGVLGMLYLLLALATKIINPEKIHDVTHFLLNNILLFFVPLSVSLITTFHLIQSNWIEIILIVFTSTLVVMVLTGLVIKILSRNQHE